jgi:hypothetical protein
MRRTRDGARVLFLADILDTDAEIAAHDLNPAIFKILQL